MILLTDISSCTYEKWDTLYKIGNKKHILQGSVPSLGCIHIFKN